VNSPAKTHGVPKPDSSTEKFLERTIFASRWLQTPLYIGLIAAQGVYVYQFFVELWHLMHVAFTTRQASRTRVRTLCSQYSASSMS
jgi:uncharacterized membrane protein YqhA